MLHSWLKDYISSNIQTVHVCCVLFWLAKVDFLLYFEVNPRHRSNPIICIGCAVHGLIIVSALKRTINLISRKVSIKDTTPTTHLPNTYRYKCNILLALLSQCLPEGRISSRLTNTENGYMIWSQIRPKQFISLALRERFRDCSHSNSKP